MSERVRQTVTTSDGVHLAVHLTEEAAGEPPAPTLVAVHGYPDTHAVWDGVVAELADRFRVVTYDVRGAGESDRPAGRDGYRMEQLVADLVAVLDAVAPDGPVHLLGHDWGSIQCWAAVADERLAGRVASFTSVSGPSLEHAAAWFRRGLRHPVSATRQLARSSYLAFFQLPELPELAARAGITRRMVGLLARVGRSARARADRPPPATEDLVHGLSLYRANLRGRRRRPEPRHIDVPVQVLAPARDPFVGVALQTQAPLPYVADLRSRVVAGGHWVVAERPDVVARCVADFAGYASGGTEPRSVAVARPPSVRGARFANHLVFVTGAASGIGRATACEFAWHGADVLVADINDGGAKETVAELERLGVRSDAYHLDVRDAASWEDVVERVLTDHGVPDVVVNNAGIGMAGPFLSTSVSDWQRILDVNVWSVIHGCRLLGSRMVDRGLGGHIVNVASAAAFGPSVAFPAYATSKAAVLMLTECLRAELAREAIAVTAICPGVINTNITRTTTFVGLDEQAQQQRRDRTSARYQLRRYGPEKVARQIVAAVAAGKPIVSVAPEAKLLRAMSQLAPPVSRRFAEIDLARI